MQLMSALDIAQKATKLFAQNSANAHVHRFSGAGAAPLKTILDAMQLDMANQYQLQLSTCRRTAAQFKEVANIYGALVVQIFHGGFLPESVYDKIVKENPNPDRLFHALIAAKPPADSADLGHLETPLSFYEFLTSLDP
jgi:hypothetical protein